MPETKADIFRVSKLTIAADQLTALLAINEKCEIFNGHFPGNPIVPGACMLQVVNDVLGMALKTSFRLKKAHQMKFLSMVVPKNNLQLKLTITFNKVEDNGYNVTAKLTEGEVICFKLQGAVVESG